MPIDYATKKAPKTKIDNDELYLSDINGFNSKVGFVTNIATSTFALLPLFKEGSKEYDELIKRLKCFRKEQGTTIDATKGLITKPFPMHWTKWKRIPDNVSDAEKELANFKNSIVVDKRPEFMRYLYGHYNKKYMDYFEGRKQYCYCTFNKDINCLIEQYNKNKSILSVDEQKYIEDFYKYNPFIETDCVVNKISKYMRCKIKEIKISLKQPITERNIMILKNTSIPFDREKYKKLYLIYEEYKSGKRNFMKQNTDGETKYKTIAQYNKYIRQKCNEISNDLSELVNLAVAIVYEAYPNDGKQFVWDVFGDGVVQNIRLNMQDELFVPFSDKNGDIEYLGDRYSMKKIDVNDDFEDIENYYEDTE